LASPARGIHKKIGTNRKVPLKAHQYSEGLVNEKFFTTFGSFPSGQFAEEDALAGGVE